LTFLECSKDVAKRPFITVGFTAFVLLISSGHHFHRGVDSPLSAASAGQIAPSLYLFAAVFGVIHYYWLVKSDVRKPLFYGALVAILSSLEVRRLFFKRRSKAPLRVAAPHVSMNS